METELKDKELAFALSYLRYFQKGRAAKDAGYSGPNYDQQGWNVYNRDNVKAYIERSLEENSLTGNETVKLVTNNALFDIADYFSPVEKITTPRVKAGLQVLIDRLASEIAFEDIYRSRVDMEEEANDAWFQRQEGRRDAKIRYEIELELNPEAYRIIDGEPVVYTEMELDINKLIQAEQRGQIKSVKYDKDGRIQIEGYDALAAQDKLLRIRGKFEKDNEQQAPVFPKTISVEIVPPKNED